MGRDFQKILPLTQRFSKFPPVREGFSTYPPHWEAFSGCPPYGESFSNRDFFPNFCLNWRDFLNFRLMAVGGMFYQYFSGVNKCILICDGKLIINDLHLY